MNDKQTNYTDIMDRLALYFGVNSHNKAAAAAGINLNTLKTWNRRQAVNRETLSNHLSGLDINMEWLFENKGDMRIDAISQLMDDISKMAMVINHPIKPEAVKMVLDNPLALELVDLLPYASDDLLQQLVERLRQIKTLSSL